jgi:hypothetical protein
MEPNIKIIGLYTIRLTEESIVDAFVLEFGEYRSDLNPPSYYMEEYGDGLALIEIKLDRKDKRFDLCKFMQEEPGISRDNWQVAYDEHFLDTDGTRIIEEPRIGESLRVAFYLHFTKFDQPLITPYGPIALPKPTEIPERLKNLFKYIPPD